MPHEISLNNLCRYLQYSILLGDYPCLHSLSRACSGSASSPSSSQLPYSTLDARRSGGKGATFAAHVGPRDSNQASRLGSLILFLRLSFLPLQSRDLGSRPCTLLST